MFKKTILVLAALAALTLVSSISAAPTTGCKKFAFQGSYTRPDFGNVVSSDGTIHNFIYQLNLHTDGSATQINTGSNDYILNTGTNMPWIGSWKCRDDGKLVVTMINSGYGPIAAFTHPDQPLADVELAFYVKVTHLFSVDDANTLTRLQSRNRAYGPADDPTDPAGGTLRPLVTTPVTYTRLVASDADLNLP